jgi:hypothetical protein
LMVSMLMAEVPLAPNARVDVCRTSATSMTVPRNLHRLTQRIKPFPTQLQRRHTIYSGRESWHSGKVLSGKTPPAQSHGATGRMSELERHPTLEPPRRAARALLNCCFEVMHGGCVQ